MGSKKSCQAFCLHSDYKLSSQSTTQRLLCTGKTYFHWNCYKNQFRCLSCVQQRGSRACQVQQHQFFMKHLLQINCELQKQGRLLSCTDFFQNQISAIDKMTFHTITIINNRKKFLKGLVPLKVPLDSWTKRPTLSPLRFLL